MDVGRYLVEAHLKEGRSVASLARDHGLHRSWIYKLLARYRQHGEAGLVPRSRRPRSSPTAISDSLADRIVEIRKELLDAGIDEGAESIQSQLEREGLAPPSVSTIWRVLRRRGFVTPQPQKRPKSSYQRFEASLPNECWQSDMTHWVLAGDVGVEIVNLLDDHSRLCLASVAFPVTKVLDVMNVFQGARERYGTPASVLTDNGAIYTAKSRYGRTGFETELERLGVVAKHSSPYHPQTCGKVERYHQTMKKFLRKQPPATSLAELQTQLDWFTDFYNDVRGHRSLARRTPRSAYEARVKARPGDVKDATAHFRVRHDKVDTNGTVTLRYGSRLVHLGMGRCNAGQVVTMLVADRDVRVLNPEGVLMRRFTIDPKRNYQKASGDPVSTMS
ncbi:MAG: IS481 family transposase [Acidobacteriota bacterium]|nr:IS481 family transposase [Acidobacteriota bacterium]